MALAHVWTDRALFLSVGALLLVVSFTRPGDLLFTKIENFGSRLATVKGAIFFVAAAALVLRVALLPFIGVPYPQIHDEFSYWLAADTFTHGRLTNPSHPMSMYFETFHVIQHPMYMSKYPPAQGAIMALGQIFGHPWIGILLSVAAMSAALVWALQAWMPATWAFLGGILVIARFGLFGYWINSYWGGAVAALGGVLVIGAFVRVVRWWRPVDAVILAFGEALLANSRPFEGFIFSLPVFAAICYAAFREKDVPRAPLVSRFLIPFATVMALCIVFMGYYNWRGTGNAFLPPYVVYDSAYQTATPAFLWEKPTANLHYANPQFEAFYNGWAPKAWAENRANSVPQLRRVFVSHLRTFAHFFVGMAFYIPFLAVLLLLRMPRVLFLAGQAGFSFCGLLLANWFQPHYAAPLLVTVIALIVEGLQYVRTWKVRNRPFGIALSRALVVAAILLTPFEPWGYQKVVVTNREKVAKELSLKPGKQLVIVRYSPTHSPHDEWVYNRASIDDAKIVWARQIPGVALSPLLNYFHGYHVWTVDADDASPSPRPYDAYASTEH